MPVRRSISASVGPMVAWVRKRDASVAVGFCTAMTSGAGAVAAGRIRYGRCRRRRKPR